MPHFSLKKVLVWSLLLICCGSFSSGYSRAVICFEQNGTVELRHKSNYGHCHNEHIYNRAEQPQPKILPTVIIAKRGGCSGCDDFEIPLQLSAPRNEPVQSIVKYIAGPQLAADIRSRQWQFPKISSPLSPKPAMIDLSFAHLQSVILLI